MHMYVAMKICLYVITYSKCNKSTYVYGLYVDADSKVGMRYIKVS